MISKEAILKTMVCKWSADDDCFVAQSTLFSRAIGTGDTHHEAIADFKFVLDDMYQELLDGVVRGYDRRGRPSKGGVNMHVQVKPATKQFIDQLTHDLGASVSQGDVIDYLAAFREAGPSQTARSAGIAFKTLAGTIVASAFYQPNITADPSVHQFKKPFAA